MKALFSMKLKVWESSLHTSKNEISRTICGPKQGKRKIEKITEEELHKLYSSHRHRSLGSNQEE
jgi:hypothetical protein